MKEYIKPPEPFRSLQYGFSQIVTAAGGKTVYLSGQVAWDEKEEETHRAPWARCHAFCELG